MAAFIAAYKFIEAVLFLPPVADASRWLVAAIVSSKYWLAGAGLGVLALLGRLSERLFGWPAPETPSPNQSTREVVQAPKMRLRLLGFNIVAGWVLGGILLLMMMAETGSSPLARTALALLGPNALVGLATFILGLPVVAAPLVLLAWLPMQTRIPLLASLQAVVKPTAKARSRRRKRP
ncbi:MAG: hypothetical protein ACRYHQ_36130 [Janthinobacterium lividum]